MTEGVYEGKAAGHKGRGGGAHMIMGGMIRLSSLSTLSLFQGAC